MYKEAEFENTFGHYDCHWPGSLDGVTLLACIRMDVKTCFEEVRGFSGRHIARTGGYLEAEAEFVGMYNGLEFKFEAAWDQRDPRRWHVHSKLVIDSYPDKHGRMRRWADTPTVNQPRAEKAKVEKAKVEKVDVAKELAAFESAAADLERD